MKNMLDKLSQEIPEDVDRFVNKSFDIADRIQFLLKEKNITQKDLAKKLGKKESEISKWLQGTHNFTLKTITKIETVLGEEIIMSCDKHEAALEEFRKSIDEFIIDEKPYWQHGERFEEVSLRKEPVEKHKQKNKSEDNYALVA